MNRIEQGHFNHEKQFLDVVYGPGGYKFGDFWPLGLVVLIWTLIVTVIVTPLYWPFH